MQTGGKGSPDANWPRGDPSTFSYQHANPQTGNESILLRFGYDSCEGDACLLIDAGAGIDIDSLLGPADRLIGICLTHAHLDHYLSLPTSHGEDVPVFTSPATASILKEVLSVASEEHGVRVDDGFFDAVVTVEEWTDIAPGVCLHAIPAGHAPGAVGFLVRYDDGATHDVVVTGDFTKTSCAGYPGFSPELTADIDVLVLTGATDGSYRETLTHAVGDALERAILGGRTLVTAGALAGVHVSRLVVAANDAFDTDVPVSLVGQGAKLYESLGFDDEEITVIPEFEDPQTCLSPGTISVAGPEVPSEDSSARLFRSMKHDAEAGVIQLVSGGHAPVETAGCHTADYELSLHPSEATLRELVEELNPVHTVVTHRHGSPQHWNDWTSIIWGTSDDERHVLYEDGCWQSPSWFDRPSPQTAFNSTSLGSVSNGAFDGLSLPSLDTTRPKLTEEGIDVDALRSRVEQASQRAAASAADESNSTSMGDQDEAATTGETSNSSMDAETGSEPESHPGRTNRLYRTIDQEVPSDGAQAAEMVEELPQPNDIVSARARRALFGTADDEETTTNHEGETTPEEPDDAETSSGTTEESTGITEKAPESESSITASDGSESAVPDEGTSSATSTEDTGDSRRQVFELDPLLIALVSHRETSVETYVGDAVEAYLAGLLRGDTRPEECTAVLSVNASGTLPSAIRDAGMDIETVFRAGMTSLLEKDEETVSVELGRCDSLLDAVVERYDRFDSRQAVVEQAVTAAIVTDTEAGSE